MDYDCICECGFDCEAFVASQKIEHGDHFQCPQCRRWLSLGMGDSYDSETGEVHAYDYLVVEDGPQKPSTLANNMSAYIEGLDYANGNERVTPPKAQTGYIEWGTPEAAHALLQQHLRNLRDMANYELPKPKWWWRFVPNWAYRLRLRKVFRDTSDEESVNYGPGGPPK